MGGVASRRPSGSSSRTFFHEIRTLIACNTFMQTICRNAEAHSTVIKREDPDVIARTI